MTDRQDQPLDQNQQANQRNGPTDKATSGPMDQRTDRPSDGDNKSHK